MTEIPTDQQTRLARGKEIIARYAAGEIDNLTAVLSDLEREFRDEVLGLSREQSQFSPGDDQWSIDEVCRHMANAMGGTARLSLVLAAGHVPELAGRIKMGLMDDDPGDFGVVTQNVHQAFRAMAQATERQREECDLECVVPHPWFGDQNSRGWVAFNLVHMMVHVNQIHAVVATKMTRATRFAATTA